MKQSRSLRALGVFVCLFAIVFSVAGCKPLMTTAAVLIYGTEKPADWDGLREKRVVVLCEPTSSFEYTAPTAARELARGVSANLSQRVPGIEVVDYRRVASWLDNGNNTWETPDEIGKQFDADVVVAIELGQYKLYEAQTLLRGQASALVQVFDCSDQGQGNVLFERNIKVVYPPHTPVSTSERTKNEFERMFNTVLADHVGRFFYRHDPSTDYYLDTDALR